MSKPLTWLKPSGEWGIEGVDLTTLPPEVYGALTKLMRLEHPYCLSRGDHLRTMSDEDLALWLVNEVLFRRCARCWDCLPGFVSRHLTAEPSRCVLNG